MIRTLGAENEMQNIITDYERDAFSAIETDYPNIKHGCFFYYSKVIYRKIQDSGLADSLPGKHNAQKIFPKIYGSTVSPTKSVIGNAGGIFK